LALNAGLELVDMEFVQFSPLIRADCGSECVLLPAAFADPARITNRLGEDLKEKYGLFSRPIALMMRDRFCYVQLIVSLNLRLLGIYRFSKAILECHANRRKKGGSKANRTLYIQFQHLLAVVIVEIQFSVNEPIKFLLL